MKIYGFCVNTEEGIHFHRVLCEDTNGTCIFNQQYTLFSFEQNVDLVIDTQKESDMNKYTTCITIPMDMINTYKYIEKYIIGNIGVKKENSHYKH